MAYMIGNTSVYTIYPETEFGVMPTTVSVAPLVIGQKVQMKLTPNIIDRQLHTGVITDTTCNKVYASAQGTVNIDGAWSYDYISLLKNYMQNSNSDGTFGTQTGSFTIVHYDANNSSKCRYAVGCTVKSINITAAPKDYVKMSVTMNAKSVSDWVDRPSMTGSYAHTTAVTCHQPALFADITSTLFSDLASITINMDSELVEDSVRYGTSFYPTTNISTKKMVTVDIEQLFDPTSADAIIDNINTIYSDQIHIGDALQLHTTQLLVDYTLADPDAGVWKNQYSFQCVQKDADTALHVYFD